VFLSCRVYKAFAAAGSFPAGSVPEADAGNGAVALSAMVPAGGEATLAPAVEVILTPPCILH
jgi:hypothetical protein